MHEMDPSSMARPSFRGLASAVLAAALPLGVALTLTACVEAAARNVVVVDSAGIPLVQNPANAEWASGPPLVEEELRIGALEGTPEEQFTAVASIDVDAEGRIYVLDRGAATVRVFDREGRFLHALGSPGEGPGELGPLTIAVMVGRGDTVHVVDAGRRRIQAFAPDGSDAGAMALPALTVAPAVAWAVTPDGAFVSHVRAIPLPIPGAEQAGGNHIIRRRPGSDVADTLLELEAGETLDFAGGAPRVRLLAAEVQWAMLSDGRMVYGRTDQYRLVFTDSEGTVERVATRVAPPQPITDADRETLTGLMTDAAAAAQSAAGASDPRVVAMMSELMRQMTQNLEIADNYPLFAALFGGPHGSVWVVRTEPLEAMMEEQGLTPEMLGQASGGWDVFDREGVLLGTLELPERFRPIKTVGDHVYGTIQDELDISYVVRLRVGG